MNRRRMDRALASCGCIAWRFICSRGILYYTRIITNYSTPSRVDPRVEPARAPQTHFTNRKDGELLGNEVPDTMILHV
jgi:hypothetical protein